MRVCIHRGARQIGGTAVEVEAEGARLLLDCGLPLDAAEDDVSLLPAVPGLRSPDASLLGIVLSHGHRDHWGLLPHVRPGVPVLAGEATGRIQEAAASMLGRPVPFRVTQALRHRRPLNLGPFTVTPFLADHSAYDSYSLLIEAGGRRLFYSGDLRGHGRKAAMFEDLLARPPRDVHAMLLEGSSLGRLEPGTRFETEAEIEARLLQHFRGTLGLALVFASAQNVDRVVSVFRAAKRAGRTMVLDHYAAEVLRATGNPRVPQPGWQEVALYVPLRRRLAIKAERRFDLLPGHGYPGRRVFPETLRAAPHRFVVLANGSVLADRDLRASTSGARAVWSQWDGYLRPGGFGERIAAELAALDVPLEPIHTSGHASVSDLQRLAGAVAPRTLTPVHSFHPECFPDLFSNVVPRADREWWGV